MDEPAAISAAAGSPQEAKGAANVQIKNKARKVTLTTPSPPVIIGDLFAAKDL